MGAVAQRAVAAARSCRAEQSYQHAREARHQDDSNDDKGDAEDKLRVFGHLVSPQG